MENREDGELFHSAEAEIKADKTVQNTAQTLSPSYRLAFTDTDFLLRRSLRSVRLQLELLKPEILQQDFGIMSTIVVFGSARIITPDAAHAQLTKAEASCQQQPADKHAQQQRKQAQHAVQMSQYYVHAREFAKQASQASLANNTGKLMDVIVTGGGPGIMEAANRGAHDAQAKTIGLTVVLPKEEGPNPYVTPELAFRFHYFAVRKMHFLMRARAIVVFPGGYGTLDELFEVLTLLQTQKINPLPILLFGKVFWDRVVNFQALVDDGMISVDDLELFHYVETAEQAWQYINAFYTT